MTSSFKIQERLRNYKPNEHTKFNSIFDHYIKPWGKCHPNYDTTLVGSDPRGVKICTPKQIVYDNDKPIVHPGLYQLSRYSRQLYEPSNYPITLFNTLPRVPPNEAYNITNDYIKLSPEYNGTGVYKGITCTNMHEFAYH